MKKILNNKSITRFVFLTLAASAVYVIIQLILAPSIPAAGTEIPLKGDYVMILLQCVFGIAALLLIRVFERRRNIEISPTMVTAFAIFMFCAIFLGEVCGFYTLIPHWDTLLHTSSGALLAIAGFSVIGLLNKSNPTPLHPAFITVFAFSFAIAVGAVWEIYEFAVDCILGTNMQSYALESGGVLSGQAALADTMKDLIVDTLGALSAAVAGYVSMKRENSRLERMQQNSEPVLHSAAAGPEQTLSA